MAGIWYFLSCLAVAVAGVSLATQQVLNSNLRAEIGSPWWAGFVSYALGMIVMLVMAVIMPGQRLSLSAIGSSSWISWTGGLLGAIFIGTAILMVPRLGAATTLALVVVGQMIGSVVLDHFGLFGLPQHPVSLVRLAGTALLIAGVVFVRM